MARETIKSFVYRTHREGTSIDDAWRAAQSSFPHRCVSWGYVRHLRKMFAEGDKIAKAFSELVSASRR